MAFSPLRNARRNRTCASWIPGARKWLSSEKLAREARFMVKRAKRTGGYVAWKFSCLLGIQSELSRESLVGIREFEREKRIRVFIFATRCPFSRERVSNYLKESGRSVSVRFCNLWSNFSILPSVWLANDIAFDVIINRHHTCKINFANLDRADRGSLLQWYRTSRLYLFCLCKTQPLICSANSWSCTGDWLRPVIDLCACNCDLTGTTNY